MADRITRKLTTILAADAERFSAAMDVDELGTFGALKSAQSVFFRLIEHHGGRVANTAGDGLIADFPSVVEAVQCAIEVQQELVRHSGGLQFRIGIHLGDVICDGEDLIGEGVNLAARLQSMADPGGILISRQVYDYVRNKLSIGFECLGEQRPKNLAEDVMIYRISFAASEANAPHTAAMVRATRPRMTAKVAPHEATEPRPEPRPEPHPDASKAAPAPKHLASQISRVWTDPEPELPARPADTAGAADRSAAAQDTPSEPPSWRKVGPRQLRVIAFAVTGLVTLNLISDGEFWPAWPLTSAALLYCLINARKLTGRRRYFGVSVQLWAIGIFLICVNLMSGSNEPWVLWPLSAIVLIGWILGRFGKPEAEPEPES